MSLTMTGRLASSMQCCVVADGKGTVVEKVLDWGGQNKTKLLKIFVQFINAQKMLAIPCALLHMLHATCSLLLNDDTLSMCGF